MKKHAGKSSTALRRLAAAIALLPLCLAAGAQNWPAPPGFYDMPVPFEAVGCFQNARCQYVTTDTSSLRPDASCSYFPNSYRSSFPARIYTAADGAIPFQVYYMENTGMQLYLVSKGQCRNLSTLVPLPRPGWYFVRYFHEAKPALLVINARHSTLTITSNGPCEIHD